MHEEVPRGWREDGHRDRRRSESDRRGESRCFEGTRGTSRRRHRHDGEGFHQGGKHEDAVKVEIAEKAAALAALLFRGTTFYELSHYAFQRGARRCVQFLRHASREICLAS